MSIGALPDNNEIQRKKRGDVSQEELEEFLNFSDEELILLLKSDKACERTSAAKILGERKSEKSIDFLCLALKKEKLLYPKIAISEALGNIGLSALPNLIQLLGKIGSNQHKTLPVKAFEKKSYPLPRDIIARTIIKMDEKALKLLVDSIPLYSKESLSEAIDAIGFISYYSKKQFAFESIVELFNQYKNDEIILWKLIRSLQAFPNQKSIEILNYYRLNHPQIAVKQEAERSISKIRG